MSKQCEYLESCGFFLRFQGNREVIKKGWINRFCRDKEASEECARKKHRSQTNSPPPDNMSPSGRLL